jgi:hypothetical protein
MTLTPEQTKKFWGNVRKGIGGNACWIWMGAKSGKYGVMDINKVQHTAHRLSFVLKHGPMEPHVFLKNSCKNPLCVNPRHLYKRTKIVIKVHSKVNASAFDARCRRYNKKFPFIMTELRDRALAEFQLTGV